MPMESTTLAVPGASATAATVRSTNLVLPAGRSRVCIWSRMDTRALTVDRTCVSMCRRFFVLVAIAHLRVLGADGVAQEDRLWDAIEPELAAVLRSTREGDFDEAWSSYRRAFELAGSSELLATAARSVLPTRAMPGNLGPGADSRQGPIRLGVPAR